MLDYQGTKPAATHPGPPWQVMVPFVAAIGVAIVLFCLDVARAGGPIVPAMAAIAPVWALTELLDLSSQLSTGLAVVGAAVLFGSYGFLASRKRHLLLLSVALGIHCLSFWVAFLLR